MTTASGASARAAYVRDSISSASPAQALTMLYDRLLLDLRWASMSQSTADWVSASDHLIHAQDIITELIVTLRPDVWTGGPALMSLYIYTNNILRTGNAWHDRDATLEAIELFEPLRLAWHSATDRASTEPTGARLSAVG